MTRKPESEKPNTGLKDDVGEPKKGRNDRSPGKDIDRRPQTDEEKQRIAEEERKKRHAQSKRPESLDAEKDVQDKGQPIPGEDQGVMPK